MQSYEIFIKNQLFSLDLRGKTSFFEEKHLKFSSNCTKMALFFTLDKNKKIQILKKLLTIPYIYDKITRLDVRRSERLLKMSYCYGVLREFSWSTSDSQSANAAKCISCQRRSDTTCLHRTEPSHGSDLLSR